MKLLTLHLFGVPLTIAWEELYTGGQPISHQAYGLWLERGNSEPLFTWHCKPDGKA